MRQDTELYDGFMFRSILANDLDNVKTLVTKNIDLDARDIHGNTFLHFSHKKNLEIAKVLLQAGVNPNTVNNKDVLAIEFGIIENNIEFVKLLLEFGIKLNMRSLKCATHDRQEMLDFLIKSGIKSGLDIDYASLLYSAIHDNSVDCIKLLLGYITREKSLIDEIFPLSIMLCNDKPEIIRLIMEYVDFNIHKKKYISILQYAVSEQKIDVVKVLIDFIPDNMILDHKDICVYDIQKKNIELTKLLLDHVDVNSLDYSGGATMLHYAIITKDYDMVKLLIEKGADVNIRTVDEKFNHSPLELAAIGGSDIKNLLIENGAKTSYCSMKSAKKLKL